MSHATTHAHRLISEQWRLQCSVVQRLDSLDIRMSQMQGYWEMCDQWGCEIHRQIVRCLDEIGCLGTKEVRQMEISVI